MYMQMQFLFELVTAATCKSTCSLTMSYITHCKRRHTVSKWTFFFFWWEGGSEPRVPLPSLQGLECSKCGVAFVATCEIWFGEGCHLKGPGSAVMTAPEHSLTQSHCLFCRLCIAASLRYLIYPSHIPSHLFSRSLLASQWLFHWAALKPDVPALRGWGGRRGEGQPNDL